MSGYSTSGEQPHLLVSDLDGTLLGDPVATNRFTRWWSTWDQSRKLVYASGRYYSSVVASFREASLPEPDAVIANVGTDLRLYPSGASVAEWAKGWSWHWNLDRVRLALDSQPEFELQPVDCQSEFKRSYFVHNASAELLDRIRTHLRAQCVRADMIYSSNRDLDVVPAGASKGTAAGFLAQLWGIPRSRVLAAGDSGNDRSLLLQGFRGIVVANAQPELAHLCRPDVHHATSGYADGVLEGLEYWLNRRSRASVEAFGASTTLSPADSRTSG